MTESEESKPKPRWKILHQIGRTQRPIGGPGDPEAKRKEFQNLRSVGMPGTVLLLDETGAIVDQILNFSDDETRRYRDEHGKPYKPAVVTKGAREGIDLSPLRDIIASQPETDPDLDPDDASAPQQPQQSTPRAPVPPTPKTKSQPMEVGERSIRLKDGTILLREDLEQLVRAMRRKQVARGTTTPPKPRSERIASQPCSGGVTGLLGAVNVIRKNMQELRHLESRAKSRRRRFALEILIRLASGAPACRSTVEAAYVDATEATRL